MKIMFLMQCRKVAAVVSLVLCAVGVAHSQTNVVTDPVGFYQITLQSNSDTIVSIPFTRLPDYLGTIASINNSNVTIAGSPGWTANQWAFPATSPDGTTSNTYYLAFRNGNKEGGHFKILSNTTDTVVLNLDVEDLSQVSAGDQISIIPHWTLGTVFPSGQGIAPSPNTLSHATEIYIPNFAGVGYNMSASTNTYYYYNNWRRIGDANNHGSDVLIRDGYFIVRQKTATNTILTASGNVHMTKLRAPIYVEQIKQDNYIGVVRPVAMSLNDSQLFESGAFSNSASSLQITDSLYIYDNIASGYNKSAAATYYRLSSGWRKVGSGVDFGSSNVFLPGNGYIIRKASRSTVTNLFWSHPPTYTNSP
jgi:uncharacterized protein (TIGR02597 family)